MRVGPFDLGHDAMNLDRRIGVEFSGERVVSQYLG